MFLITIHYWQLTKSWIVIWMILTPNAFSWWTWLLVRWKSSFFLRAELYTEMSNLNRESFMTILGDVWNKWATLDLIIKSGKRVGISINGLNINWMQQDKLRRAEALLEPAVSSPPSSSGSFVWLSPVDICILSIQT